MPQHPTTPDISTRQDGPVSRRQEFIDQLQGLQQQFPTPPQRPAPAYTLPFRMPKQRAPVRTTPETPEMHAPTMAERQANMPQSTIRPQTWWEQIAGDIQQSPAGQLMQAAADIQNRLRGSTADILQTPVPGLGGLTIGDVNDLANAIMLFHGSPHSGIKEFDLTKMSSGEGGQMYGWGLPYAAEARGVAETYRGSEGWYPGGVTPPMGSLEKEAAHSVSVWMRQGWDSDGALGQSYNRLKEAQQSSAAKDTPFYQKQSATFGQLADIVKGWRDAGVKFQKGGGLYSFDLPDEQVPHMLDWDEPLGQQPQLDRVKRAFAAANSWGYSYADFFDLPQGQQDALMARVDKDDLDAVNSITGESLYEKIADSYLDRILYETPRGEAARASGNYGPLRHEAKRLTSQQLNDHGVPGIKYLDQFSRRAGEGTRNFVIFDPGKSVTNLQQLEGPGAVQ